MGVTSIRLNKKEEELLNILKDHYSCDTSTIIKKSLWDMYEDIDDNELIDSFEKKDKRGKSEFLSFEEIMKDAR